jgi:hypothetical protein
MKTTIEIPTLFLRELRKRAAREGVTLQTLIERGLRHVLAETTTSAPFTLRCGRFKGNGLQPEFCNASWDRLRDAAYEDRGA